MRRINFDTDYYRRDLPHLQKQGKTYFVTFRLAGSLPANVVLQLKRAREFKLYDSALDSSTRGPDWLRQPQIAKLVFDHIIEEATRSYRLDCFVVMSNHVHVVLAPTGDLRLDQAMRRIKQPTAFHCNCALNRRGAFWQDGSYDHIIRANEWERIIRYVLMNPVKAGLVTNWKLWPWTYLAPHILGFE